MRGPFTLLPRPPANRGGNIDPFELEKWFTRIWLILSGLPGISWSIIDKAESKLSDLEERTHAMLQSVLGWSSGADTAQVRHISQADGKVWQDHVEIVDGNPHGTDHAMLDAIEQSNDTSADADGGKHVTDAQVKKYEDHRLDATIHHTLEEIQDSIAGMLTAGNAVTLTYDDAGGTLTVAVVAAAASSNAAITVAGAAGAAYTATEQGMINALKADAAALRDSLNDLKANMRTAGSLAT